MLRFCLQHLRINPSNPALKIRHCFDMKSIQLKPLLTNFQLSLPTSLNAKLPRFNFSRSHAGSQFSNSGIPPRPQLFDFCVSLKHHQEQSLVESRKYLALLSVSINSNWLVLACLKQTQSDKKKQFYFLLFSDP